MSSTFPLYIAVLAFVESVLVAGRLGPRLREPGPATATVPATRERRRDSDVEQ